jgi:hypothetical protein
MLLLLDPSKLPPDPKVIVRFEFSEPERPLLLSLSSLLYDIELVHDLSVIVMYDEYDSRKLATPFFYYRKGRGIESAHMVRTASITKQSPLALEIVVAAVGAVWALVQIIEKVGNWSKNREKLQLEIQKLRSETALKRFELDEKFEERLQRRNAEKIQNQLVERLGASEFMLRDLSIRLDDPGPGPKAGKDGMLQ